MRIMKELFHSIESAVYEAMERGVNNKQDIYNYVCTSVGQVPRQYVYSIVDEYDEWPDEDELYMSNNTIKSLY